MKAASSGTTLALILFVCAGCGGGAVDQSPRAEDRPVAGIETDLAIEPAYSIGSRDEPGTDVLWNPVGLDVVGDKVFVLDRDSKTVRIFSKDGRSLGAIGSEGQGPGEFRSPMGLAVSESTLYVTEPRRLHAFSVADGSLKFTKDVEVTMVGPVRVLGNDDLAAGIISREQYSDRTPRPGVVTFSPEGDLLETRLVPDEAFERPGKEVIEGATSNGVERMLLVPPFQSTIVWNIAPSGAILVGAGGAYEFDAVTNALEATTFHGPSQAERAAVLPAEGEWYLRWVNARIQATFPDHSWTADMLSDRKPFFTVILADNEDRLWVVRPVGAWRRPDCDATFETREQIRRPKMCWGDRSVLDAFDPDSGWLGTLELPEEIDTSDAFPLLRIVDNVLWAKTFREDGNHMITGYTFRLPGH